MIPGLLVTEGSQRGVYFHLPEDVPFWIGRKSACDFTLERDPRVSGQHCYFLRKGETLQMTDKSTNGTFLNGRKIHHNTALLKNTDILCVGSTHLQVIDLDTEQEATSYDVQAALEDFEKRKNANERSRQVESIGPYLNIEIIGWGAFTTVYKAIHQERKQLVALKVFSNLEELGEEFIGRFFVEVKLLQKLNHPNIIFLYDSESLEEDGEVHNYIAMEYFQGINLSDHMKSRNYERPKFEPMPWKQAFHILFQVSSALDYMHGQGVIHRDLKPNNIMYNEITGVAKIIDLGLGRSILDEDRKFFFTTQPGSALGTPDFMPIEQWHDARDVDERADIYALGATTFFLLTAQLPHGRHEDLASLYEAVIHQKKIPLESLCSEDVPKEFIELVEQMMAFHAEDRFNTSKKVLRSLESIKAKYFE